MELGGHTSFDLNKKAQLLSMAFSEEEVNSAINQLGENADLEELSDVILTAQNAGCSVEDNIDGCAHGHDGINEESAAETSFGTLLQMGFTETEVSRAIDNFGTDVTIWRLADSIYAGQIEELGGHSSFDLNKKAHLLSMAFSEEEVNSAINQLGENADLEELLDVIFTAQNAGRSVEDNIDGYAHGHDGIN